MSTILELPVRGTVKGLCTTCEHAPQCTHLRPHDVPTLMCDDMVPLSIAIAPTAGIDPGQAIPAGNRVGPKGLCATCTRHPSCRYPKLEGGVWHCEEFDPEVTR
ncbi:MAG TPA: hypothetical protein VMR65_08250 [Candidatus Sulfotelmatobacter sp.]|jgi:hypothetical protein|nr:hypothetical protein [Candidatus Sulfotelmatobacter sp.]